MKLYEHRQVATLILALLTIVVVWTVGLLVRTEMPHALNVSVAVVGVAFVLLFWCLNVEVTEEKVSVSFGFGWIRRSIPISDIVSVQVVRNKWWYGLGIRLTPHGWMFNVAGLDAVELEFRNEKKFRIGSEEPAKLHGAIEKALGASSS